jgi:hypothetical protein
MKSKEVGLLNTMIKPTVTVTNDRLSRVAFVIRSE